MLGRPHKIAIALIVAGLTGLNTGCTSNRLLKPKGFGWLGDKGSETNLQRDKTGFPPPSSVEVPQSINSLRNGNRAGAVSANPNAANPMRTGNIATLPNNAPNSPKNANAANQNHSLVQAGLYDVPSTPPITTAPAVPPAAPTQLTNNGSIYGNSASVPLSSATVQPADSANALASSTEPNNANQQRSIYETTGPVNQNVAPIGYEAPIDLPALGTTAAANSPPPAVQQAIVNEPVQQAQPTQQTQFFGGVAQSPSQVPPATTGGTFYQARATQPRPWRPGSTSDLKTL